MEYKECTIKGFEGYYRIYENGDIYSIRKKRMLKPRLNNTIYKKYAYLYVALSGTVVTTSLTTGVHRIIAHHFIKPILNEHFYIDGSKLEVNHKDGNKLNNHKNNLELVTHQQNMIHARQNKPNWSIGVNKGSKRSKASRDKMAKKKHKKVLLFNDNQHIIYGSIAELCEAQKISRRQFNRWYASNKSINGLNIRYL